MAAAFSRLQLAAALLEYDNDPDDPSKPTRSAQESAIFANFRRNPRSYPPPTPHQTDYLGVSIDGDEHGMLPGDNPRMSRASALSINTIGNPFRVDDQITEEGTHEEEMEVDLASWGLDSFMPKEKHSTKGKQKATAASVRSQPIQSQVPSHQPVASREELLHAPKRALSQSRSLSVGGALEVFGTERPPLPATVDANRRRSTGALLDEDDIEALPPIQRRRASSYGMLDYDKPTAAEGGVPFPAISVRSASPNRDILARMQDRESVFDGEFGAYPRETERSTHHSKQRTMSNATMGTFFLNEDNPFAVRPPSVTSRFDPKAAVHARTMSNASMGSRMLLEQQDAVSIAVPNPASLERERRYSTTLDLLRPKVLVMPSPLQGTTPAVQPTPPENIREGFELSKDGPPLPPGARASRRASQMYLPLDPPASASNLFTPNPTASMSLSQMTFRNTLHVDGTGTPQGLLPRATEEGQQVELEEEEETPVLPSAVSEEVLAIPTSNSRPPGKLFGKSLMDDLEDRKAQMRNKSRTFYGDDRPTMMARNSYRSSTFIDPATLQDKPTLNRSGSLGPNNATNLTRRNSSNIKPLLNFDDENTPPGPPGRPTNLPNTRSVFGVDTLWEREMAKLKIIEAQEKEAEEQRKRLEEAEEAKRKRKKGKKGKVQDSLSPPALETRVSESKVSMEPPVLPDIPKSQRRAPPVDDDDDSDSEQSDNQRPQSKIEPDWHASSDEDEAPKRNLRRQVDEDDDVPLSAAHLSRSHLRAQADSDDERPLSFVMQDKRSRNTLAPPRGQNDDEDEDEKPLGLRYSTMMSSSGRAPTNNEDEDDRPLGLHPEQQRRSHYQMMSANAQMQQAQMQQAQMQQAQMQQMQMNQQMFLQAQMQQQHSYFPQPPVMHSPFFGPPTMSMVMQPPIQMPPSPPPMQDPVKIGRIDSWRQNVAYGEE